MMIFDHVDRSGDPLERERAAMSAISPQTDRVRVGIFNVKFSPNLGDGLLSECLEAELGVALPSASIGAFDLAGRTAYAEGRRLRAPALAVLHHSPQPVRHAIAETVLGSRLRRRLRPRWREALRGIDAVIVGGGNLLGDTDLNFPLKLDAAMAEVRAARVPAGVFAVGVSDGWSRRGQALFRRAFSDVELYFASVRETRSAEIWRRRLGPAGVKDARVVHDPAVLTALHFPRAGGGARALPLLGLGLTHPIALKYHSNERGRSAQEQEDWYIALTRACIAKGWTLAIFTNGSPEDEAYAAQLRPRLSTIAPDGTISFTPRFRNPGELAEFISTLDLLMAHRLHANIAAYSYGIPHIGFSWDVKLRSFLAQVGRAECICSVGIDPVDLAVDLAAHQLDVRVEPIRQRAVIAQARTDVAKLGNALKRAVFCARGSRLEALAQSIA